MGGTKATQERELEVTWDGQGKGISRHRSYLSLHLIFGYHGIPRGTSVKGKGPALGYLDRSAGG